MKKKIIIGAIALVLVVAIALLVILPGGTDYTKYMAGTHTYRTYTALSPSNWNELTYKDNNDTQIMSYIGSSFYSYDFATDDHGKIIPGEFVMKYEAATKLEDTTAKYAEAWGLNPNAKGYSYTITLREDLKWDDGTPIKAEDFVYTMKQQLDPLFQNYRADSFYVGATVIANAQEYAKQGQTIAVMDNGVAGAYELADLVKGADGVYTQPNGKAIWFTLTEKLDWCGGKTVTQYAPYMDQASFTALKALADEDGKVAITDESIALWKTLINTKNWGYEDETCLPYYWMVADYTYPELDFSKVGIFVGDTEYEIVLVLEKALPLLKEDGSLSYQAAYNMASLPLVKKDLYEACKQAPAEGSTLWTTTYNTSKDTTASWGPYKLTDFQGGKQYVLDRNEHWYGYGVLANQGFYETDRIVCDTIKEWQSAWTKFLAGEIDGIGIDVTIADEYKHSDRAYFTPDDFVAAMQLQSNKEALVSRQEAGKNKALLTYTDFRKALSLAINRADFCTKTTTSSLQGFGLFNTMHYYDVENGGVFRNSDEAKKVLCEIYAVDYTKYESLDAAVDAITGYNLEEARKLVTKAYNDAIAAGDINEGDVFTLTMGSGTINETVNRRFKYIADAWTELFKGTPLEGKFEYEIKDFSEAWADDFRAGAYDVCMGGWSGAAWDPGYFLLAYLSPDYMYSKAWDTSAQMLTFTMKGVGPNGEDITETMSLMDWYDCLNGAGAYDWSANALEQSQRLQLIAALEKEVLAMYYTVPLYNNFSASLLSYKIDYVTYEYNTFMGYGGMKYMKYNYTDGEWAKLVDDQKGELNYK